MPPLRKTLSRLLLSSALAAASLVFQGCRKSDGEAKKGADGGTGNAAVPVVLRPAHVRPVQRSVEVVGTLWGDEDVTVSNKVNGKVIATYKDVGDRVEPGEPLAQLLRNDYQLSLNQRTSALRQVLAQLGTDKVPPQDFDVSGLPAVRRAKFQADNARAKFERGT